MVSSKPPALSAPHADRTKQEKARAIERKTALMDRLGADFPSRAAATRIVKGVFSLMAESLAAGKPVRMQGFGSFETYKAAPRRPGREIRTQAVHQDLHHGALVHHFSVIHGSGFIRHLYITSLFIFLFEAMLYKPR